MSWRRIAAALARVVCLFAIVAFVVGWGVPWHVDAVASSPVFRAMVVDLLLLLAAGFVMLSVAFASSSKTGRWPLWSCGALLALSALWQPVEVTVWSFGGKAAAGVDALRFVGGTATLLTVLVRSEVRSLGNLKTFAALLAVWAASTMSLGRLSLAVSSTLFAIVFLLLEEREPVVARRLT